MDAATLTILMKSIGMLVCFVGGLLALRYGFRLYRDGAGRGRDKVAFSGNGFSVTANSVGSVLMITAVGRALVGYAVSPNLKSTGDTIEVYSFETPRGSVTAPAYVASVRGADAQTVKNPRLLRELFDRAVAGQTHYHTALSVDGRPAKIDSVELRLDGASYILKTRLRAAGNGVVVEYEPQLHGNELVFQPTSAASELPP